jgi:hypothetical protein
MGIKIEVNKFINNIKLENMSNSNVKLIVI